MKLLLTSGGVTNASIRDALVAMLGKPIEEASALCIPTAMYGHPWVGPGERAWKFISGRSENPMVDLGWRSVGVLELTALPSIDEERWVPLVRETDVLLAAGGDVRALGVVDFSICPHLVPDGGAGNTMAEAERWAAGISAPAYVLDDQTAITVVDGVVDVVSEGDWTLLSR